MIKAFKLRRLFVSMLLFCPTMAFAEDTDIFMVSPGVNSARPNILLVIDNAASNNSQISLLNGSSGEKLEMIRQVLQNIVDPLNSSYFPSCTVDAVTKARVPEDCVTREEVDELVRGTNIGLMIGNPSSDSGTTTTDGTSGGGKSSGSGSGGGIGKGGYVRYHVRPMNVSTNRDALVAKLNNGTSGIPQANNAPYAKLMHEAYLYYGGKSQAYVGFDSGAYDAEAKLGNGYLSPITDGCQKNYIFFLGNGGPDSAEDKDAGNLLSGNTSVQPTAVTPGGVLTTDPVSFTPDNYKSSWFDEYARTLFKRDVGPVAGVQNVITYTVAVQSPADNNYNTLGMRSSRELLKSAAALGGGEAFEASDGQQLMKIFINVLRKMQAVNTVFSSSTLPVSVNVRGTFLNQVYMGQFRPDENARPRWPGNLKQYQIALDNTGNPMLADRNKKDVENKDDGFIKSDRTSFWTTSSNYWAFDPMGVPASASDAPDGAVVEKGGAAQRLRSTFAAGQDARKLYSCPSGCAANADLTVASKAFNTTNITPELLGLSSTAERDLLVAWIRGADNHNNEDGNNVATDIRARVHGDLVHSRPAVVNYNRTAGDRDVMVYYGANDGIFHAVKGGQHDDDGVEQWGLIFPEHYREFLRLRNNSPTISSTDPKPYFADGPVSVYQKDADLDGEIRVSDGDKVYLYVGMRRGGRFAYALDVTDPDSPKYLWKIDNTTDGFADLGQTWSTMRPAKINAVTSAPVVIFGGGYDPESEDVQPALDNTKGNGIYVVNALTGVLEKHIQASGMGAIPGDLTVIDRDGDGAADRIYAADTKGNIWRVDINDANTNNWAVHKIASLAGTAARKFLNKPDIVFGDNYDAVLVGSGDRENPFDTTAQDRFYMIKDTNTGLTGGLVCGSSPKVTCTESHLTDVTSVDQTATLPSGSNGWYLRMAAGEKVVGTAVTVFGRTFFATNRPVASTAACGSNLGEARLYALKFDAGTAALDLNADGVIDASDRSQVVKGGGYLPNPVYSPVEIDGKIVDVVCTGSKCFSPGKSNSSMQRYRTHWYIEQ